MAHDALLQPLFYPLSEAATAFSHDDTETPALDDRFRMSSLMRSG
jgi:hypothetical protein